MNDLLLDNQEKSPSHHGRLIILTGDGKGKSSSAFGMVLRAVGWGMPVTVIQFVKKGGRQTGEEIAAIQLPGVTWHVMGQGFSWIGTDPERHRQAAQEAWDFAKTVMNNKNNRLVVLDEILYAIGLGWLEEAVVIAGLQREQRGSQHVILTGRGASLQLIDLADTVTEMREVKHTFRTGGKAAKGVEF